MTYPAISRWRILCGLAMAFSFGCESEHNGDLAEAQHTQLNTSLNPADGRGHQALLSLAFNILQERQMLPPQLATEDARRLVMYGAHFADNPDIGRPGAEATPVATPMDGLVSTQTCPGVDMWGMHVECAVSARDCDEWDLDALSLCGEMWNEWIRGGTGSSAVTVLKMRTYGQADMPDVIRYLWDINTVDRREYTQDNLYHYALADVARFSDQSILSTHYYVGRNEGPATPVAPSALRMYPLQLPYQDFTDRVQNQNVVVGSGYGAATYGAILFQLSRRFFAGGSADPDITELVHAGSSPWARPGWSTGGVQDMAPFEQIAFQFPDTYLGGQPFTCTHAESLSGSQFGRVVWNPCAQEGGRIWPIWVPQSYELDFDDVESWQAWWASLGQRFPGQQDRAALIYLGWAAHMFMDVSMPHHAANWTGFEHDTQDAMGDIPDYYTGVYSGMSTRPYRDQGGDVIQRRIWNDWSAGTTAGAGTTPYPWSLQTYAAEAINGLLGQPGAEKTLYEICDVGLGINNWMVPGDLDSEPVARLFLATAEAAYGQRQTEATEKQIADYLRAGLLGTLKLILCGQPRPADPAVVAAIEAPLL